MKGRPESRVSPAPLAAGLPCLLLLCACGGGPLTPPPVSETVVVDGVRFTAEAEIVGRLPDRVRVGLTGTNETPETQTVTATSMGFVGVSIYDREGQLLLDQLADVTPNFGTLEFTLRPGEEKRWPADRTITPREILGPDFQPGATYWFSIAFLQREEGTSAVTEVEVLAGPLELIG